MSVRYARVIGLVVVWAWLMPAVIAASCPSRIDSSVQLSEDWFCPVGGPVVDAAKVEVHCQNHSIRGAGTGVGLRVLADQVVIRSCHIEGFDAAVVADRSFQGMIADSSIAGNRVGVLLDNAQGIWLVQTLFEDNQDQAVLAVQSSLSMIGTTFRKNSQDVVEVGAGVSPSWMTGAAVGLPVASPSPLAVEARVQVEVVENNIAEAMFTRAGISPKDHAEAAGRVTIYKSRYVQPEKMTVVVVLVAQEDVQDLVVYEVIPKDLTSSVFDLSSSWPYTIIEPDPIVRFEVGSVKKGQEVQIRYDIKGRFGNPAGDSRDDAWPGSQATDILFPAPSSLLSVETSSLREPSWVMTVLFVGYMLSFVAWFGFEWHAKEKQRIVFHTVYVVVLTSLFLAVYTKTVVVGSAAAHQALVSLGLFIFMLYYVIAAFLELVKEE